MRKLTYMAVFEPTGKGTEYSVYFPDLQGCISRGNTLAEAQKNAEEALDLHIYGSEKDGDPISPPTENPLIEEETANGYIVSYITTFPDIVSLEYDNKSVKTNITLPAWIKELGEEKGVNFSRLLQAALIDYLGLENKLHVR